MKKTIIILSLVLMFGAGLLYAGSGDLIVNHWLSVGYGSPPDHQPAYPLDVNGNANVAGDVNITGNFRINNVSVTLPNPLSGAFSGLAIANDATSPTSKIDVTANNVGTVVPPGIIGIDCSHSGQAAGNDLDTGTLSANTWYYIWVIYNGTTVAGLASSDTSPALPASFSSGYKRLVGMAVTNSSSQFVKFHQFGNQTFFDVKRGITLTVSWPAYTPLSLSFYAPPNAATALIYCSPGGTGSFNASNDGTNLWISTGWTGDGIVASESTIPILTTQTIWYAVSTSSTLYIEGFMLNL